RGVARLAGRRLQRLFVRLAGFFYGADHVEVLFVEVVVLAVEDLAEAAHRLLDGHEPALQSGELLRYEERLGQEALYLARALHHDLLVFAELFDTQDGDDVLQVLVLLQHALHASGNAVVLLTHHTGVEDGRGRRQRVDGGIEALVGQRALQGDGGIEVGEGCHRRGIRVVVRWDVNGLHGGDGALLGGGDALLQGAHLGGECRLVAHGRRHAAEQRRNFRAGLNEAEDVIDEQEDVLPLFVAEVFGQGDASQADAQARSWRLVHLAEHHSGSVDDARFRHLVIEVVAFARTLAHAGEHGVAAVLGCDVADQLLDDDRLAHAGTAEGPHLASPEDWRDEVDDLDAGLEQPRLRLLIFEGWRMAMDGIVHLGDDRALLVDGLAQHVEDAA